MMLQTYNMIDKNWSHVKYFLIFFLYTYNKIWTYGSNNQYYSLLLRYKIEIQWAN